jgi:hypothetical protein
MGILLRTGVGWWKTRRGAAFRAVEKAIFREAGGGRKSQRFSQAVGSCGGTADWLDSTMVEARFILNQAPDLGRICSVIVAI